MQKYKVALIICVIIIVLLSTFLALFFTVGLGGTKLMFQKIATTDIQVIRTGIDLDEINGEYVAWIYVTVCNFGEANGTATVHVALTQDYDQWDQTQTVHLYAVSLESSRYPCEDELTFAFRELTSLTTSSMRYSA